MIRDQTSPEWFDPSLIRFKISPHHDLSGIKGGNWDIERRYPIAQAVKHRSVAQRYTEGLAWEETDLFKDVYSQRIKSQPIRGEATMKGLLAQYYGQVDALFEAMKANGFQLERPNGKRNSLIRLLIGRNGEVFIGNQGNHRLAMANVLGLKEIAGEVICRHRSWNVA